MRVAMARVLLGRPDVLLMDEPTNHLDIESIVWLESFLKTRPGRALMTSHDRQFMNRVVTRIAEIDGGEIVSYSGNYDFYDAERTSPGDEPGGGLRAAAGHAGQGAALHRALLRPRGQGGPGPEPHQGPGQDREDRAAQEAPGRPLRLPAAAALGGRGRPPSTA
jgi:energy-coupling factor transporter ATP-binding protein EcfA2